ncbi:hypothetical protein L7F22_003016 [Adiantum nelumboides]|nr:hypothetical protein [Adiantum nelumboides]
MPTAAQRQRTAALAQLNNQHKGQPSHRSQLGQPSTTKEQSKNNSQISPVPPTSSSKKKIEVEWDDGAFSDEDSEDEEAAAFEMDGQDIWTQNYCSICDTLIEPGQGLNAKRDENIQQTPQNPSQQSLHSPTSSISRNSSSGLKSKSGTIKARPPSSDGVSSNVKRTHSAGRIHAVGGSTGFGPSKRTGSAGSRLNALSELKPTTKLNQDNGKNTRPTETNASGNKSPAMSRRSSNVSVRSGNSGGAGANSSGPSSPMSPTSALPRTKKGGIMGALTPAALKQQEDLETAKSKAPPALYCSERCRLIDEQRGSGMGELVYYLHQPTSPTAPWQTSVSGSYGAWSSRASNPNISALALNPAEYRITPPESECNCPECMEKNSTSGTVPSGASDTTESSNSYQYGPRGYKQRTTSGRIVTPQNLYPPGGHKNDYFGNVQTTQAAKRRSQSNSIRDDLNHLHTHRDSMSQTGTESSARSSDSGSDLWEPRVRGGLLSNTIEARARANSTAASLIASDAGRGSTTTGTVTPEGMLNRSVEHLHLTSGSSNGTAARVQNGHHGLSDSLSTSQASTTSPLRLLRYGDHRGRASVDVTSDVATSPQPYANTVLSRSIASERTEDGASSGFTVAAPPSTSLHNPSIMDRRHSSRASMVDATISGETFPAAELSRAHFQRFTDSPAPLDSSTSASRAVGTLKSAQARAAAQRTLSSQSREIEAKRRASTNGDSGQGDSGGSSSSWFRSSISAAWNTLRGAPSSDSNGRRDSMYEPFSYRSEDRGMISPSADNSDGIRTEEPTPTQSLIKRPTIKRGDVPAFANEIGRGDIPGERSAADMKDNNGSDITDDNESAVSLSKSAASAHGSIESERLRKKAERERAHRHQRSRDVAVLPPLLGVARPPSSANLQGGMRTSRTYSSTSVRSDAMPDSPLMPPVRSNTPGLRRGSSHSASLVGLQEYGTSPGFGTSPRRAGLGWGALTPLGPPAPNMMAERSTNSNQSSNLGRSAHHATHHHHHHHHHSGHHHHHNGHHNGRQSLQPPHHRSQGAIPSGTIGMLGMHPHGNAQIKGRHSTTPVRMSTPRVPEHGGEMSGAQLKGEEKTDDDLSGRDFMQSRSLNRRSYLVAPPTRPQSGMSMRGQGSTVIVDQYGFPLTAPLRPPSRTQTPANATEEGQNSTPVRLYPVLDIPNRQPTHDRYDQGWALGDQGLIPLLPGKQAEQKPTRQNNIAIPSQRGTSKRVEEQSTTSTEDPNDPSRKKLFYFDTS